MKSWYVFASRKLQRQTKWIFIQMFNKNNIYIKKRYLQSECTLKIQGNVVYCPRVQMQRFKSFKSRVFSLIMSVLCQFKRIKEFFFIVEFICGCPACACLSRPILVEKKFSKFSILSGQSVSHDVEPNIFPSDPRSQFIITQYFKLYFLMRL